METAKTDSTGAPASVPVQPGFETVTSSGTMTITGEFMDALADALERRRARSPQIDPLPPAPVPVPVAPVAPKPEIDWKKEIQSVMSMGMVGLGFAAVFCALAWYIGFAASHSMPDKHAGIAAFVGFICMSIQAIMSIMSEKLVRLDKWTVNIAICYVRNAIVFLVTGIVAICANVYVLQEVYTTNHQDGLIGFTFFLISRVIFVLQPLLSAIVFPVLFMVAMSH